MEKIILFLLLAMTAFSCANDPVSNIDTATGSGMKARLTTPGYSEINTKATNDYAITDVWALQYINSILVKKTDLTDAPGLFSGFDLPADVMTGNTAGNVIYFFANTTVNGTDPINTDAVFAPGATLAALESYRFTVTEGITFASNLPMRGEYRGAVVAGTATEAAISMTRMAVKINFSFDATALNQFVASSIQLCNVPNVTAFPANANEPELPVGGATAANPAEFVPYPAGSVFTNYAEQPVEINHAGKGDYTWYMAENARGSFTGVTTNRDKHPASTAITDAANAATYTYILMKGSCIDNSGNLLNVSYKIYLGGNATGDMNLIGNTVYNVATTIMGTNDADTRITVNKPDIATTLTPLDKANSYILNAKTEGQIFYIPVSQAVDGVAAVNATGGNTLTFNTGSNWTADVLWQTWQATSAADQLGVSRATGTDASYIRVVLPAGIVNGNNAVIALKDANGVIIWSWHLWITDYNPDTETNGTRHTYAGAAFQTGGIYAAKKIMDRNLGATWTGGTPSPQTTAAEAAKAYGLMYQWGRKDAFTPASGASTSDAAAIYGGAINSPALSEGSGSGTGINKVAIAASTTNNLANAVQNPMTFYLNASAPNNWYTTSSTSQNNTLWRPEVKTVFDPCPPGYRVPGAPMWNAFTSPWAGFNGRPSSPVSNTSYTNAANNGVADGDFQSGNNFPFRYYSAGNNSAAIGGYSNASDNATNGRLYTINGVNTWYPASGGRSSDSGAFNLVGSSGYYWSGSVTGTSGYSLGFSSTYVSPATDNSRAYGFSVRCIQE